MTADILSFARGVQILRGHEAEQARQRRIQIQRQAAFRRATTLEYSKADIAMFGPMDDLLRAGPGADPRLSGPCGPARA